MQHWKCFKRENLQKFRRKCSRWKTGKRTAWKAKLKYLLVSIDKNLQDLQKLKLKIQSNQEDLQQLKEAFQLEIDNVTETKKSLNLLRCKLAERELELLLQQLLLKDDCGELLCKTCFVTGSSMPTPLKVCNKCYSVWYCSRRCQRLDWKKHHKNICGRVAAWRAKQAAMQETMPDLIDQSSDWYENFSKHVTRIIKFWE